MSDATPKTHLSAEDADHARVLMVALTICHHRNRAGHRFTYNPTGATITVTTTTHGKECLERRGVI